MKGREGGEIIARRDPKRARKKNTHKKKTTKTDGETYSVRVEEKLEREGREKKEK